MLENLKEEVCDANLRLVREGLVVLTWGNVSAYDAETGLVVIKPSGVPYAAMKPSDMVVVDLKGMTVEGALRPSSDTPTHLELYRAFHGIGAIVHTHSLEATTRAQARLAIPCYGTTHADCFHGPVPVTRLLTAQEVAADYEGATGRVIVECFDGANPAAVPGVLVAGHGPFSWGRSADEAVDVAVTLEAVATMARHVETLAPHAPQLEGYVLEKHYERKHGAKAYYGQ